VNDREKKKVRVRKLKIGSRKKDNKRKRSFRTAEERFEKHAAKAARKYKRVEKIEEKTS
jgi:hypothetical protein